MDLFTNIYFLLMSPLIADAKANQSSAKLGLFVKNPPKIRLRICEIGTSYLCQQQFDKFWIWSESNDRKRKLGWKVESAKSSEFISGGF